LSRGDRVGPLHGRQRPRPLGRGPEAPTIADPNPRPVPHMREMNNTNKKYNPVVGEICVTAELTSLKYTKNFSRAYAYWICLRQPHG
jgi:hypothetical protein